MTKEVKIGLIGIAALAMLIFGINYLKGINMFQSANYYYVEYTNINGLAGSSPVFANGYKVGTVRNINYNYAKPGHVTVEVEVDKEMRIWDQNVLVHLPPLLWLVTFGHWEQQCMSF